MTKSTSHSMKEEILREYEEIMRLGGDVVDYEGDLRVDYRKTLRPFISNVVDLIESQTEKRVREELGEEILKWAKEGKKEPALRLNTYAEGFKGGYNLAMENLRTRILALLNK